MRKRIIHRRLVDGLPVDSIVWRGIEDEEYAVDKEIGTIEAPHYLLTEVDRDPPEDFNAETHRLAFVAPHADLEAGEWVRRSWDIVELTGGELAARARKLWPTVAEFWAEFSPAHAPDEKYLVETSPNPAIIFLREELRLWLREVASDDPRILRGLEALVSDGILTSERKAEILAKD